MQPSTFRTSLARRLRWIAKIALALAFLALPSCGGEKKIECFAWDSDLGACPSRNEAYETISLLESCNSIVSVDGDAAEEDGKCCYEVTVEDTCCTGGGCAM
jgi:hypothetical protein